MSTSERLVCNACSFTIRTSDERQTHYKSEWHRYNVKRRCAGLAPIPSSTFSSQLSLLQQQQAQQAGLAPKVRTKCNTCGKAFNSKASFDAHLLSKKHQKMERDGQADEEEEDEDDDEEGERQGEAQVQTVEDDEMRGGEIARDEEKGEEHKESDAAISATASPHPSTFSDADRLVAATADLSLSSFPSAPAPAPAEYDGYTLQAGEVPIPLLSCLFCPSAFPTVSASVSHMHKQHGFFLPFLPQLASLDGLLTYIGEKVGIGHCCVYCSQRFSSTAAAQQHMREKSHAKMRLDTEEDEEEYSDYYDFDQEQEGGGQGVQKEGEGEGEGKKGKGEGGEKRAGRRGLVGVSDAGELLMSDGSTIGHRQYAHVYSQHVRVKVEKDSVTANFEGRAAGHSHDKQLITGSTGTLAVRAGGGVAKDSGKRYRESWVRKNERRLHLAIGMRANIQMHYRPQVQF